MRREEKLRESMLRYLDGSLSPDELERLNQAVENDWAARHEMAELMLQDVLLTRVGREAEFFDLDEPKAAPPPRKRSSCTTTRILRIHKEHGPAQEPAARRRVWPGIAIAAALLFAVSVAVAVKGQPAREDVEIQPVIITVTPPAPEIKPEEPPPPPPIKAKMLTQPKLLPPKAPARTKAVTKKPKTVEPTPKPAGPVLPDGVMTLPVPEPLPPPPPKTPPKTPPKPPPKPKSEK